ncbi:MAG: anti-sigma factor antagonist [Candidatus Cloacimonetes bacterium]|nr:anti-sigma factor antagonist [Candidatus Cloacimonadota bacterium]
MLEIKVLSYQEIPCLILKGRLDGFGADLFEKETHKLYPDSSHWIVDFQYVDYMSSAGIRALLKKEKELRKTGGKLVLFGMDQEVAKVLHLTGLSEHFTVVPDQEEALAHIGHLKKAVGHKDEFTITGRRYLCNGAIEPNSMIDIWNNAKKLSAQSFDKNALIPTNLNELGISFGLGGFGNSAAQAQEGLGLFVSLKSAAGVSPADGYCRPDFLFTGTPLEVQMYLAQALSFSGEPSVMIKQDGHDHIIFEKLLDNFHSFFDSRLDAVPPVWGFIILAETATLHTSKIEKEKDLAALRFTECTDRTSKKALIIGVHYDADILTKDEGLRNQFKNFSLLSSSSGVYAHAFLLDNDISMDKQDMGILVAQISKAECVKDVVHIEPMTEISDSKSWIFLPSAIRPAEEKQLAIETSDEISYNPEWDTIIRRIYADCGKVILNPLHGGFTSTTFNVTSYDKDGRRLLPTVLKIGSIKNNDNEVNAYHKYVKKFILNNSTTIMGTTTYKNWGGLRYNFLGINGSDSTLVWLTDYYKKYPAEKLIPLFDRIFTDILKPWYGQPHWEHIHPYVEHSPLALFTNLYECLERELGISADTEKLKCDELDREIINPFYFLKHEYPRRKEQSKLWYKAVTHGDLNMQNILLDEKENIYIIDFSETKPRSIIADFARLEPIFKIEMCTIESADDLKKILEFEQGLLQPNQLGQIPPFIYHGEDPMVEKAYKMICKLREYANVVTLFETDITPYLIALLEWTYSVVCYTQLNISKKKYALYSAALMCEKILELEQKKA